MIKKLLMNIKECYESFLDNDNFEDLFYKVFLLVGLIMTFLTSLMNYCLGLSVYTIILPLFSGIFASIVHLLFYRKHRNLSAVLIIANNNFIFSPFMWLTNLGFNGGFQYFIFTFMIFAIILLKGKSRRIVVVLYFLEMLSLMILEAFNRRLIVKLSGMESNTEDMIVSLLMSMIAIAITFLTLSNLYRNEQKKIVELSTIDTLTKRYNRRFIIQLMDKMYDNPSAFDLESKYAIFFDIDDFKAINDKQGHAEGDRVLIEMCKTIGENIRETDYLARMGGDEFSLLLNTESFEKAKGFLDRLLKKIQKENNITISAGIAKLSRKTGTTELLEKSDEMMYAAKRAGKNRFFTAEDFQRGL